MIMFILTFVCKTCSFAVDLGSLSTRKINDEKALPSCFDCFVLF